jgi:transposase
MTGSPTPRRVADKGFDSQTLRQWLKTRGTTSVIPPRSNRKVQSAHDEAIYRKRNVTALVFCRLRD